MKALIESVVSKYTLSGMDLFFNQSETGESLPYCILYFINGTPDYNFTAVTEDNEIQFSIFASTADQAMTQGGLLMTLFDDCVLNVTGYDFVKMQRVLTSFVKNEDVYQYIITYQILIHKQL